MPNTSDAQLLRDYAAHGSEPAFAELVARHTDLVYSAALRQTGSPELAREIAQSVFTDLARKARALAGTLSADASLAGWLFRGTRFAGLKLLRDDHRRQTRERQFMEHFHPATQAGPESAPGWEQVAPVLDEAMAELDDTDHEAVLLRYFKNQDFHAVALALGVSDAAAQKRVSRAVERLRDLLAKRGVTASAGGLVILISANAILVAPAGLSAAIVTTVLAGTTLLTTTTATVGKAIAMTTTQKVLITAALAAAIGAGIYQARKASGWRNQVSALEQQQTALTEQLIQQRGEAVRQLAAARDSNAVELARLRGEVTRLRWATQELAQVRGGSNQASRMIQTTTPIFENQGNATPEAAFRTFLWAAKSGDTNLVNQLLRWRREREDAVSDEMANEIATAQARGVLNTFSNLAGIQILGQKPESPDTTRLQVEFIVDNGKTHLGEIYVIREGEEWRTALNFSRREGSRTISIQFLMPMTPESETATLEPAKLKSATVPLRKER